MRRDRVAIIGGEGLFEDSLVTALASKHRLRVRRFPKDGQDITTWEIGEFEPDVVVVVRSDDEQVPQAVLVQMKRGVPIVTLDPLEPTMTFSRWEYKAPATLESVLDAVNAGRFMLSGRKASEKDRRSKGGAA